MIQNKILDEWLEVVNKQSDDWDDPDFTCLARDAMPLMISELKRLYNALDGTPELVEALAAKSHKSWSGWFWWMKQKWNQKHTSGELFQERWIRQADEYYDDLSEEEKDSDRSQAHEILTTIRITLGL